MKRIRKIVYGGATFLSLTTIGLLGYNNFQDQTIRSMEGPVLDNRNTGLVPFEENVIGNKTPDKYWKNTREVIDIFEIDGVPLPSQQSYWIRDLSKDAQERLNRKHNSPRN